MKTSSGSVPDQLVKFIMLARTHRCCRLMSYWLLSLVGTLVCQPANGLIHTPLSKPLFTNKSIHPRKESKSSLEAMPTKQNNRLRTLSSSPFKPRQSQEEQRELLRQVKELRKIKTIESELALQTSSLIPSSTVVARACGYGDDVGAMESVIDQGHCAREDMITRNMGLVYFCVKEIMNKRQRFYQLKSLSKEDLVQEGAMGLARAIEKWDITIGGRFSTYAVYWIRAAILRCIAERDELVRIPESMIYAVNRMTKAAKHLGIDIDGDNLLNRVYSTTDPWKEALEAKELAEVAGLSDKQLLEAMKVRKRRKFGILSYESWMQQGRDLSTDDATNESPFKPATDEEELKKTLARFLRPKEMEAICWRYGLNDNIRSKTRDYVAEAEEKLFRTQSKILDIPVRGKWGESMSFTEIGKKMSCSAEYGRKLCHAALEKLRQAAHEGVLEPALLI